MKGVKGATICLPFLDPHSRVWGCPGVVTTKVPNGTGTCAYTATAAPRCPGKRAHYATWTDVIELFL